MNKKYHKILITVLILVGIIAGYNYFSNSFNTEASESPLNSSVGELSNVSVQISGDTAFIASLNSLRIIKIDTSIFKNKSFNLLKDNSVILKNSEVAGRSNPFAPFSSTSSVISPIVNTSNPIIYQTMD